KKEREEEQQKKEREREKNEGQAKKQGRALPPEFLVKLKDSEVVEGDDIGLEVVVSGEPQSTVKWFLDDQLITSGKRHQLESRGNVHSLTITNVDMDDEGIYECVVTNS
ncbi:immunoglobulin domain-containing protein, partial [Salmonella sp. s54925]|uniref:immunoglobulin domain-containing protein n=1 Tax=Salmonella sp. s54925 TaxID=3159674 RepID=UPI003980276F